MSRLMKGIKALMTSRLAVVLCLFHLVLFLYAIFEKPAESSPSEREAFRGVHFAGVSYFAGRYFHFAYESTLYQFVTLLDFPAMILALVPAALIWLPFKALGMTSSERADSWIEALLVLATASLQ